MGAVAAGALLAACGGSAAPASTTPASPSAPAKTETAPLGRELLERKGKPGAAVNGLAAIAPVKPNLPATSVPGAASSQSELSEPRGIYVYSEHLAQDAPQLTQALTVPGIDGLTLLQGWASIEPDRGEFNWAELDQWMNAAASSGKQVALAIRAGQDTPCWLFQSPSCGSRYRGSYAGATPLTFSVSPREGVGQSRCNQETIAAPWDPAFLSE